MIKNILSTITFGLFMKKKRGKDSKNFIAKLLDKNDTRVAVSSILVLAMLFIGLILLAVPIYVLIIEAWYNHTISTDLNGLATYISAVAAIFATAGITKIGVQWTDRNKPSMNCEDETDEEEIEVNEDIIN